jgi:hypothetical protein
VGSSTFFYECASSHRPFSSVMLNVGLKRDAGPKGASVIGDAIR